MLVMIAVMESNFRQIRIFSETSHCISLHRPLILPPVSEAKQEQGQLLARMKRVQVAAHGHKDITYFRPSIRVAINSSDV